MTRKIGSSSNMPASTPTSSTTSTSSVSSASSTHTTDQLGKAKTEEQNPQSSPELSEQGKSQRKGDKQMSGIMKQAVFQSALGGHKWKPGVKPGSQQGWTPGIKPGEESPKSNLALGSKRKGLQEQPTGVDPRPQVVRTADGKFNLIRPAPPLENLILRGGGAKGVGNPPALVEMEKQGKLNGLKHVVGTSAGALTALCLASGNSATDFQHISDTTKMTSLLKTPKGFDQRYPTLGFGKIGANGGAAVETADRASAGKVSSYLSDNWDKPEFKNKLDRLVESENQRSPGAGDAARTRLGLLRHQNFAGNRTNQMITFNDLRLLNQMEPSKFRNLTLTGWDETNKKATYFDAKNYPDMPVAVAGRISMAIPPVFASVKYDPKDGLGKRDFADGGIGTNMPSEVVTRNSPNDPSSELTGRQRENVLVKTGIMTFDEQGDEKMRTKGKLSGAYLAMHGSDSQNDLTSGLGKKLSGAIIGKIAGNPEINIVNQRDQQKIAESAANCFLIAHGELSTFSLGASSKKVNAAKEHSLKLIQEQLKQRENQAYAQEFTSVNEIFGELSSHDKQSLLNGPIPDPSKYPKGVNDMNFQAEMDLYNMVVKEKNRGI